MSNTSDTQFTFRAYKFKLTGPLLNNDTNITLSVDEVERINLAPFVLLEPDQALEITVVPIKE